MCLGRIIGRETASWLCIVLASPFTAAGFFSYNGLSFEQFIWAVIKSELLFAGERKYISENPYFEAYGKGRDDHD